MTTGKQMPDNIKNRTLCQLESNSVSITTHVISFNFIFKQICFTKYSIGIYNIKVNSGTSFQPFPRGFPNFPLEIALYFYVLLQK